MFSEVPEGGNGEKVSRTCHRRRTGENSGQYGQIRGSFLHNQQLRPVPVVHKLNIFLIHHVNILNTNIHMKSYLLYNHALLLLTNTIPKAAIMNSKIKKVIMMSSTNPAIPNTDSGMMSNGNSKYSTKKTMNFMKNTLLMNNTKNKGLNIIGRNRLKMVGSSLSLRRKGRLSSNLSL